MPPIDSLSRAASARRAPEQSALLSPAAAAAAERGRETRERLLDAAEALFAEHGFEGTSLRAVTQAAGASVSAANYHFGSKHALLRETLRRRVEPVNAGRIERLDALERNAAGKPLRLTEILEAFLAPLFEQRAARPAAARELRFVAARLHAEPPAVVAALKQELFGPLTDRFLPALASAVPERSPDEVARAFQFAVGVMVHVLSGNLADAPGYASRQASRVSPASDAELLHHMVAFLAAGFRASPGDSG